MNIIKSSVAVRTLIAAVVFASTAAVVTPASAEVSDGVQRIVRFRDLDLTTSNGATALYERLQTASRAVCASNAGRGLDHVRFFNDCYVQALNNAVRSVNESAVTALHSQPSTVTASNASATRAGA